MSYTRFSAVAVAVTIALIQLGSTSAVAKTNHLLTLSACPPWKVIDDDAEKTKQMAQSCQNNIDTIVPALRKAFAIEAANTTTRLNADADFMGVEAAIVELSKRAGPEDRVVLYLNFHGGQLDLSYQGYPTTDEVIATYTVEEPEVSGSAVADRKWMAMRQLRNLVDRIKAGEIIIVMESCESGSAMKDFRYDLVRRYRDNWKGREAIIFSSRALEAATYTEDGTAGLFTKHFADGLEMATSGNIRDIFEKTALAAHRARRDACWKDENLKDIFDDRWMYREGCNQMPEVYDPYGLLDDIQVGGVTAPSRWDELKNRVPEPTVAKKKQNSKAPAHAAANAKSDEDPFAWAAPYLR